jgi:hypothetical protein
MEDMFSMAYKQKKRKILKMLSSESSTDIGDEKLQR